MTMTRTGELQHFRGILEIPKVLQKASSLSRGTYSKSLMGERIIPSLTNTLKLFFENIVRVTLYQHSQDKQLCTLHRLLR